MSAGRSIIHRDTYLYPKIAGTKAKFIWQYSVSTDVQQGFHQASIADARSDIQGGIAMFILKIDDGPKVTALVLYYPHEYLIEVVSGTDCTTLYASKIHDMMQD